MHKNKALLERKYSSTLLLAINPHFYANSIRCRRKCITYARLIILKVIMKCNRLCSDANVNHSISSKRSTTRPSRIISLPSLFLFVICARLVQQQNSNFLTKLPFKYSNLTVSQNEVLPSTANDASLESSNYNISNIRRDDVKSLELEALKTFPPRNETPMPGWVYEPPRVSFFWKKMPDRKFISQIYPRLRSFNRVLDVGARDYNRYCKSMLNSSTTKYYQIEPFPPEVLDNDGFLHCKVHEIPELYPEYKLFFDAVMDIGVLGVSTFNSTRQLTKDILDYTSSWRLLCYTELIILQKIIVDKSEYCNILYFRSKVSNNDYDIGFYEAICEHRICRSYNSMHGTVSEFYSWT
jgi:hypothetical protein